ncbi:Maltose permease MAL31 [Penicillium subrubescens]|uniref:Maltose permease MAL31 n=1 Tax=Penicillium subrubescens TaxID=1316194 RepID=A0A1Q5U5Y9_9EURO|nr:Maltose permease MAL31 [Penicillium subrubescens]
MQGYDLVGGGQLAALPQFRKKFGILEANGSYLIPAHYLSAWSSIAPACEIVATFIFAPLLEKFGRKPGILVAAFISAGGILLQQLAGDWTVHLAGRGINVILVSGWLFFPESPYWLIRQGKTAQGRKSLKVVYGFRDESFYDAEINRMEAEIRVTRDIQGDIDARHRGRICGINFSAEAECFRGTNLKRTMTAIFAASAQQMIGATFVIGYATYFLELIGVNDYFNASVALYVVMLLASMAAFPLTEIIGRRTLIVGPQFALCAMLLLIGVMGCIPDRAKASWGIVAFIYVWAIIYQLSIGATGFVLASELATMRLRGATQGLVTISNAVWGLIMQFTIPYMINPDAGNLGGKVGFIFLATGLIAAVGGFFLYPETKGISFEKLDELFALKVKPRHFKQKAKETAHIVTGEVKLDTRSVHAEQIEA